MNKFWWLIVPLALLAAQSVLEITLPSDVLSTLHSENGPHELLQFFVITAAFFVASYTFIFMNKKSQGPLAAWIGLAAICCFYVSGEEISWGQHFLDWTTPEFWDAVNDQHETNLHNTSSWLDQKPRLILEIGVLVGGIIIPALRRFRPALLPKRFEVIYPPSILAVTAGILVLLKLIDTAADLMHVKIFERVSEVQEVYMFYFVLLYLLEMKNRALGPASR